MTGLKMEKAKKIEEYLDYLYPNPKCELNYTKDYELLIATVLSAQATDRGVNKVTGVLFEKYKTIYELKDASISDIIDIIKPIGSYNHKASYVHGIASILCNEYNGIVPNNRKYLESMPGVGRKVTNVFLSEWYKEPNIAVDTHVERVSKRLNLANKNDNVLVVENKLKKVFTKDTWSKRHLQLVLFGRYKCKSVRPLCQDCLLKDICISDKKDNYK